MAEDDKEIDQAIVNEVHKASQQASDAIQHALLHAITHIETEATWIKLLGIEMALLTHAACIRQIEQEGSGVDRTVDGFLAFARDVYNDIRESRPPGLKFK